MITSCFLAAIAVATAAAKHQVRNNIAIRWNAPCNERACDKKKSSQCSHASCHRTGPSTIVWNLDAWHFLCVCFWLILFICLFALNNTHRFVHVFGSCSQCYLSACRRITVVVRKQLHIGNNTYPISPSRKACQIHILPWPRILVLPFFLFQYLELIPNALPYSVLAAIQSGSPKRCWRMQRPVPKIRLL